MDIAGKLKLLLSLRKSRNTQEFGRVGCQSLNSQLKPVDPEVAGSIPVGVA